MEKVTRKEFWMDLMEDPPENFRLGRTSYYINVRKPSEFSQDICYTLAQVHWFDKKNHNVNGHLVFRVPREFY